MPTSPFPTVNGKFAGSSYPDEPAKALRYFQAALNRVPEPKKVSQNRPPLFIVPHIDFRVNLDIYGLVYKRLLTLPKGKFPETFVILGVGHQCPCEFSSCPLDYETVFGRVGTDHVLWSTLQNHCQLPLPNFPDSFDHEHSIEFVVVWLQALCQLRGEPADFKILPILMSGLHLNMAKGVPPADGDDFHTFSTAFQKTMSGLDPEKTCIIASIDGCHVGPRFDHPFAGDEMAQRNVQNWESELWSLCRSDRFNDFFQHIAAIRNAFYFDGVGVLSLLLQTYSVRADVEASALWHEDADQSFVTFSGGTLAAVEP